MIQTVTITQILRRMMRNNINRTEAIALLQLSKGDDMTIGDLASPCGITAAAMTGRIDTLERKGLVKRELSKRDRRKVFIRLTNKGCDIIRNTFTI